jgi:hypothetical protein
MSSRTRALTYSALANGIGDFGRNLIAVQELQNQRDRESKSDEMSAAEHVLRMLRDGAVRGEDLPSPTRLSPAEGTAVAPDIPNPGAALLRQLHDRAPGTDSAAGAAEVPDVHPGPRTTSPGDALHRMLTRPTEAQSAAETGGYTPIGSGFFFPTPSTAARLRTDAQEAQITGLAERLRAAHPSMTDAEARLQATAAVGKLSLPSYNPATMQEELDEYGRKQGIADTYDARQQERGGAITRRNQQNAHDLAETTRQTTDAQNEAEAFALYLAQQYPTSTPADVSRWLQRKYPDAAPEALAGYAGGAVHTRDGTRSAGRSTLRAKLDQLHSSNGGAGIARSAGAAPRLDAPEIEQARSYVARLAPGQQEGKLQEAGYSPEEIREILGGE